MGGKSATKGQYFEKLKNFLDEYKTVFIVGIDNVSSQQMHEIRMSLRGEGVVLMGKNTMVSAHEICCSGTAIDSEIQVRRALKGFIAENPQYERLLPHVKG